MKATVHDQPIVNSESSSKVRHGDSNVNQCRHNVKEDVRQQIIDGGASTFHHPKHLQSANGPLLKYYRKHIGRQCYNLSRFPAEVPLQVLVVKMSEQTRPNTARRKLLDVNPQERL